MVLLADVLAFSFTWTSFEIEDSIMGKKKRLALQLLLFL